MNSNFSKSLDTNEILDESISIEEVFSLIEEEYSIKNYGKNKFNIEVLYWIGYIYRYFSYTYELSSRNVYKIIKPKELNELYYVYHTFDPSIAISRILEEKNISFDVKNQNEKLLEMLKERKYQEEVEIFEDNFNTNSELYSYRIVYDEEFAGSISLKKLMMIITC